ncbi:MAG: 30S ribosomal protein S4e [Candidatus Diapherotrites archaeon]|nr:30S ribosomal protein S4e [Candidatus Diapherotrites archaeon]
MARKGEKRVRKRLTAPKTIPVPRKGYKFIVKASPGPHNIEESVPLLVVIRDMLHLADTAKEAKKIIHGGKVLVDGKVVKNPSHPIGFMDVLSIPSINKFYRVLYDRKGRIKLYEIEPSNSTFKLSKIKDKTAVKGGKIQLNLHDGKNILADNKYKVGDVVKLEIPQMKITDHFPLQKGSIAYVTGGKHAGEIATIEEIVPGTATRKPLVILKSPEKQFETRKDYVFVIGTKEPVIKFD